MYLADHRRVPNVIPRVSEIDVSGRMMMDEKNNDDDDDDVCVFVRSNIMMYGSTKPR